MTNEEAIKTLKANYPDACFGQLREAVDAAIEALKAQDAAGDTISRQAAVDAIDKIFPADPMRNDYTQGITCGAALATEYIKQLPSAQPQRTGRWIDGKCNRCGTHAPYWAMASTYYCSEYCPHCGAYMVTEEEM